MHGADFVPVGRVRGEIACRLLRTRLARFAELRAIGESCVSVAASRFITSRTKPATGPLWLIRKNTQDPSR